MSEINGTFLLPLKKLSDLLSKAKTRGVIIGGISVGLLGKPRFTADIDALILLEFEQIERFIDTARKFGFIPRIKPLKGLKDVPAFCALGGCNAKNGADTIYQAEKFAGFVDGWEAFKISASMYIGQDIPLADADIYAAVFGAHRLDCCVQSGDHNWCIS